MLRRDAQIVGRESDALLAFAAFAERIGAASFCGSGNAAVAHGDFSLVEIFNAKRVAKSAREFLKFQDFAAVGFFVDAMSALMPRELSWCATARFAASMNSSMMRWAMLRSLRETPVICCWSSN